MLHLHGGKSSRIVNYVLALKSYAEWKQGGEIGTWKYGGIGISKPTTFAKTVLKKISEPFMKSLRTMPSSDRDVMSAHSPNSDSRHDRNEGGSFPSLHSLVCEFLCDKRPEEIPTVVESLLSKVMEECERRTQNQNETLKTTQEENVPSEVEYSNSKAASVDEVEKEDAQHLQFPAYCNQWAIIIPYVQ